MKLRKGERIVCSKGHHAGDVRSDVADHETVPAEALSIPGPNLPDALGYTCEQCGETIAMMYAGSRWTIRTARGWVE